MKYTLIYSYTTVNYNVYICQSKDPKKNGMKFYIPRFLESSRGAETYTNIIIHDAPKANIDIGTKHTPLTFKQEDLFYVEG